MVSPATLAVLAVLAGGMSLVTAGLIKWAATARSPLRIGTVLFLLLMMIAMVGGALVYFLYPGRSGLIAGFWVASALMSVSVLVIFAAFVREVRESEEGRGVPRAGASLGLIATITGLVLVNEVLMGWTFLLADGGHLPAVAGADLVPLSTILCSPWFLFPMAVEMGLTVLWIRGLFSRPMGILLAVQPFVMLLAPPAFPNPVWVVGSALGTSAAMAALLVYLFVVVYRGGHLPGTVATYAARVLGAFGLMGAGLAVWAVVGATYVFALAILVQMAVFFFAAVGPERFSTSQPPIPSRAKTAPSPVARAPTELPGEAGAPAR